MAVMKANLVFGSETFVVTHYIRRALGGVRHWVARLITGKHPWRKSDGICKYPLFYKAMRGVDLDDMET